MVAPSGGIVSRYIRVGRGSKRRVRQIKWKRWQLIEAILLLFVLSVLSLVLAVSYEIHHTH
jgi:competence protein ComGF